MGYLGLLKGLNFADLAPEVHAADDDDDDYDDDYDDGDDDDDGDD